MPLQHVQAEQKVHVLAHTHESKWSDPLTQASVNALLEALVDSYLLVENREAAVVEDVCNLERCEVDASNDFGRSNADRLSMPHASATP